MNEKEKEMYYELGKAETLERVRAIVEGMKVGDSEKEMDTFSDRLPGGFGCCGEEVVGFNLALSDVLTALEEGSNYEKMARLADDIAMRGVNQADRAGSMREEGSKEV